jgi:DNA (cytosine-5)-methyltransferase 1
MADNFLLRNVSGDLAEWIDRQCGEQMTSKQEFLLSLLHRAREQDIATKLPLLAGTLEPDEIEDPRLRFEDVPFAFSFVDLFAGIGGFRVALSALGGRCLFSCEWDKYAQKTYRAWFGETPAGDIRNIKPSDIPDHDVLAAGFPCQPFSIAGVSKKKSLGHAHGFKCETQGNLFFHLATVAAIKRPPVLFLENVKNLQSHDQGRTWQVIYETLDSLGYKVFHKVIDAAGWVPQHRERVYIVCFDKKVFGDNPPFEYPEPPAGPRPRLRDILDPNPPARYTLTDHLWNYLQEYAERHKAKGNGFGFGLPDHDGVTRTLSARYFKDGSEILISQQGRNPRRLTPLECSLLMGFGDSRKIVVSDTQAYRQFGNAVVPKVVEAVGREILKVLAWQLTRKNGCLLKRPMKTVTTVTADELKDKHYGLTPGGARDRGRNGSGKRDPQVHLAQ